VGLQVVGRWIRPPTYPGHWTPLSPDPSSPRRTDPAMRPIWALWKVPLVALLPDARDRASVDEVENDGTRANRGSTPARTWALALAIGSPSPSSPPMIVYAKYLVQSLMNLRVYCSRYQWNSRGESRQRTRGNGKRRYLIMARCLLQVKHVHWLFSLELLAFVISKCTHGTLGFSYHEVGRTLSRTEIVHYACMT